MAGRPGLIWTAAGDQRGADRRPRNLKEAWNDERNLVRREQRLALALTKAKAEADVTSVITGSAPASFSYFAATIPSVHRGRECETESPVAAEAACAHSQGEPPSSFCWSRLVWQAWRSRRCRGRDSGLPRRGELRRYLYRRRSPRSVREN